MVHNRGLIWVPLITIFIVGLLSAATAIWFLYNTAYDQESARLKELAQSQARLIEAVARFDAKYSNDYAKGARAATISQVVDAHGRFKGSGKTSEFVLAGRENESIVFILSRSRDGVDTPAPIPFNHTLAEPMRRALTGNSGMMTGLDYRGERVLATYEPVDILNLGIVAKIDISEIRAPYINAAIWTFGFAGFVIVIASLVFTRITTPLIEQLVRATEAAQDANKAKSLFLANMSHELRTPLNAIIGFSDMIRYQILGAMTPHKYQDYVEDIHSSGNHLLDLINEILDMSKIDAGKYTLNIEDASVFEIITESVTMVQLRATQASIDINISVPTDLPNIAIDKQATKQILINFLTNAVKFTPSGGKITVGAGLNDGMIMIAVTDTGVGMTAQEQERAMQPFIQIEREKGRSHEGTGLGLPLSKQLIEKQGGTMILESEPDKGTKVTFALPWSLPLPQAQENPAQERPVQENPAQERPEKITWFQTLSVGIDKWDDDHWLLIQLIEQLREAIESNVSSDSINAIMAKMTRYSIIHLTSEEHVMKQTAYPGFDEHKAAHDVFRHWLDDQQSKRRAAPDNWDARVAAEFLIDWWYSHILKVDMEYEKFFEMKKIDANKYLGEYKGVDGSAPVLKT